MSLEEKNRGTCSDLDQFFDKYRGAFRPGAALLVLRAGVIAHQIAVGSADLESSSQITSQTNFRLASLTKSFTAMAIALLLERKLLTIESPLTDFFPSFPDLGRKITIRHLLHHTSGLLDYETLIPPSRNTPLGDPDVLELLSATDHTLFAPGHKFQYSNSGYVLLGLIIERIAGMSFPQFITSNLFVPCEMRESRVYTGEADPIPHRAFGHSKVGDNFGKTDQNLTSGLLGDGGVYSSLVDLHKWILSLTQGELLRFASIIFTPGILNDRTHLSYGWGWQLNRYRGVRTISHAGSTIGFRNFIAHFPELELSIVLLTNRSEPIDDRILDLLLESYSPRPLQTTDQKALSLRRRIVGTDPLDPYSQ